MVWTVIAVESGDVLNVRAEPDPDASIVGTLEPWATNVSVSVETRSSEGVWRRVIAGDETEGWANARFLVAQPAANDPEGLAASAAIVDELVSWVRDGNGPIQDDWFASRALWFGGIGIYADGASGWDWIPTTDLDQHSDWERTRLFLFNGEDCGSSCRKSLSPFLKFDRLDSAYSILIDDIPAGTNRSYSAGFLRIAPDSLHRVVIDKPDPDRPSSGLNDWQRINFVFDWSSGEPRLSLIHTWGWTA